MELFHRFPFDVEPGALPLRFNNPFYYSPHWLCVAAANEVRELLLRNADADADARCGKMFGVLVVRDAQGAVGFLAAFSGLLAGSNSVPGFVPPVCDFQAPDGYFKCEERCITAINREISDIRNSAPYVDAKEALENEKRAADEALAALRNEFAAHKASRAALREKGELLPGESERLIKESQFEKAELKRATRLWQQRVLEKEMVVRSFEERLDALAAERRSRSVALQQWLFEQFRVLNATGKQRSLLNIFASHCGSLPPAGAGECAAPKLLQFAYLNNLQPLAMAEFWVGASPVGEVRREGCYYGACKSKCEPILSFMLQGLNVEENALEKGGDIESLEVIYEDEYLLIVDKPAGVLSVPGIVGGTSVQQWLREEYLHSNELFVAHRLDMATSGLLVAAKSMEVYKALQQQFAGRKVEKLYVALLDGVPALSQGTVELPLAPDYAHRPRQMVDSSVGKPSLTHYRVTGSVLHGGRHCALVHFIPVTGRTHQLRVHAAHAAGLNCPIVGDALYGIPAERLMLHARSLSFVHPVTGERLAVEKVAPFESEQCYN